MNNYRISKIGEGEIEMFEGTESDVQERCKQIYFALELKESDCIDTSSVSGLIYRKDSPSSKIKYYLVHPGKPNLIHAS